jgi:hypothetical protein
MPQRTFDRAVAADREMQRVSVSDLPSRPYVVAFDFAPPTQGPWSSSGLMGRNLTNVGDVRGRKAC